MYSRGKGIPILHTPSEERIRVYIDKIRRYYSKNKYRTTRLRLLSIELLRAIKKYTGYKSISAITNIPTSILCRYTRGNIIPKYEQAERIVATILSSINFRNILSSEIRLIADNPIDTSRIVKNPSLNKLLSTYILIETLDLEPTGILVSNPLLTAIASHIAEEHNVKIIVTKTRRYPGTNYYEGIIVRPYIETSSLYIDKDLLTPKDSLLVITDIVFSGRTLRAILDILEKARANAIAVYALITIGRGWINMVGRPINSLLKLP